MRTVNSTTREAIHLLAGHGWDNPRIADAIGMSRRTVEKIRSAASKDRSRVLAASESFRSELARSDR